MPTAPPSPTASLGEILMLGLESSCDETAAAIVAHAPGPQGSPCGRILANVVRSQWQAHRAYGGVVPEIAARAHVECMDLIVADAMAAAGVRFGQLTGIAATAGPGLIGGLIVGLVTAKSIALVHDVPFVAVNHLEAHALTVGLTEGLRPPYLLLLVSGGHTQLVLVSDVGVYTRLGTTIDDALGEAFDKTAKLLGLGQPGGPAVEQAALAGDPKRFAFPRPMHGREGAHFSFAGLKTAVRQQATRLAPLSGRDIADLCAGFQAAAAATIVDRTRRAMTMAMTMATGAMASERLPAGLGRVLVVAGGVAANQVIRQALETLTTAAGWRLSVPPIALCTDNAAMVAWAGAERLARGQTDALDTPARARWPLDINAAPVIGSGRLGTKA